MMSRLSNLKKAEDKFRKISITDDYTIEERQEIKKFVDEAKTRNLSEEGNFFWRIRGSPKIWNGTETSSKETGLITIRLTNADVLTHEKIRELNEEINPQKKIKETQILVKDVNKVTKYPCDNISQSEYTRRKPPASLCSN